MNGEDMNGLKDGRKTTEWMTTVITIVGLVVGGIVGKLDQNLVGILASILAGLYLIARTVAKMTKSTKDDEILDLIKLKILSQLGIKTNEPESK